MTEGKKKAWLPPSQAGKVKASIDGKAVPYGKPNAIELTEGQLDRLREAGVTEVQTETVSSE